jgi:hypothetical protein
MDTGAAVILEVEAVAAQVVALLRGRVGNRPGRGEEEQARSDEQGSHTRRYPNPHDVAPFV